MGNHRTARLPNADSVENGNGSRTESPRSVRFGVFELDLRAGELRRNGQRVKLQEQPFQILAQLIETPGGVVTREELRDRLWSADTFVDFDHSLNAAIRRLRDALGDSAENPTFVETVARRGYRFLAPVQAGADFTPVAADPLPHPATLSEAKGDVVQPRHWWVAVGVAAVVLLLIGVRLGILFGRHHPAAPAPSRITRLTATPTDDPVRAAAISHDGKYLAFSDQTGFYLRQIDTGETHALNLPPGLRVENVSWFPDSAHMIVALNSLDQSAGLWEVSALGGSPRKLYDDGNFPAVSPDGKQIAFIGCGRMRNQIWLMAAEAEQPRKLLGEDGEVFGTLAWSPDSTRLAYTRGKVAYDPGINGVIEWLDLRNSRVHRVLQIDRAGWYNAPGAPLAWISDGRLIYTLAEAPPRQLDSNLWSIEINPAGAPASESLRLTSDAGNVVSITASADGKRIVYLKGEPEPDVYVARIEGRNISEPVRLTLDDRQDLPFDWTPDGKSVVFISDRTGVFNVYRQAVDQTMPELLIGGDRPTLTPRLSPDGTQLLYLVSPPWTEAASSISLMRTPLAGGAPQKILEAKSISNQQCARAPATTCLYSAETAGKMTFLRFDPEHGSGAQVFEVQDKLPEVYNWSLSPDGSLLAIARGKEGGKEGGAEPRIHLVSLDGAPDRWLTIQGWTGVYSLDWAADGRSLWAASVGKEGNALLSIDLQGNARAVWRPEKHRVNWAIPSRDGKYLALHVDSSSANAWMLERP